MVEPNHRPLIGIRASGHGPAAWPRSLSDERFDAYTHALAAAGGAPIGIPLNLCEDALRAIFGCLEGLCLPGGPDLDPAHYGESRDPAFRDVWQGPDPAIDATELLITQWALEAGLPILGICRGIQVLNVVAHGNLYQDIATQLPNAEQHAYSPDESPWDRPTQHIRVERGSRLARILAADEVSTNSFHHQGVRDLAPGFVVSAWAQDGVVEGIEAVSHPFAVGVQWHPEGMYETDAASRRLFAAFVSAAKGAP